MKVEKCDPFSFQISKVYLRASIAIFSFPHDDSNNLVASTMEPFRYLQKGVLNNEFLSAISYVYSETRNDPYMRHSTLFCTFWGPIAKSENMNALGSNLHCKSRRSYSPMLTSQLFCRHFQLSSSQINLFESIYNFFHISQTSIFWDVCVCVLFWPQTVNFLAAMLFNKCSLDTTLF